MESAALGQAKLHPRKMVLTGGIEPRVTRSTAERPAIERSQVNEVGNGPGGWIRTTGLRRMKASHDRRAAPGKR